MPLHVLDANVIIHGSRSELPFDDAVTTPAVTAEMESFQAQQRFEAEDISIREPDQAAVNRASSRAEQLGADLSDTDIGLVALADQLDAVLVTDDYDMQNLAAALDVEHESFMKDGIDETKAWKRVCTNCGQEVEGDTCPVCNATTKRVPR